jgi:hypothetical protein
VIIIFFDFLWLNKLGFQNELEFYSWSLAFFCGAMPYVMDASVQQQVQKSEVVLQIHINFDMLNILATGRQTKVHIGKLHCFY